MKINKDDPISKGDAMEELYIQELTKDLFFRYYNGNTNVFL
ncbi:hypothetical protein XF24_00655 [candidate division SR1 bacterium Aalborg_AAW-1]|nr:hypothetical protein XF24_00655 [candidate division SR1 bacterium Aalborg_AAW-1]